MPYWITDPGHAWLAVSLDSYPDALNYGTGFGFLDATNRMAYLEEDCEAPAFLLDHPELDARALPVHAERMRDAACRRLPSIPDRLDYDAFMARRRAQLEQVTA